VDEGGIECVVWSNLIDVSRQDGAMPTDIFLSRPTVIPEDFEAQYSAF